MKTVGIIGLGWTGLPLAQYLKSKSWEVIGSTTTDQKKQELEQKGLKVVTLKMNPHPEGKGFQKLFQSEYLVINIPPRSRVQSSDFYLEQLKYLKSMINQAGSKKVLFVSSTGIYPSAPRAKAYDESFLLTRENTGNPTLWDAEQMITNSADFDLTILRFGGLMGEERVPGKYFSGKEQVKGHTRVNYIHQDDAVRMIAWILENDLWDEIYNGVAPIHSVKKEIFEKNAKDLKMPPPLSYEPSQTGEDRLIDSEKIIKTGFVFKYPDPLDFPYSLT
ncbi:NAD(P)H-binding protein [Algoriphagus lutimaris]|uniref:NAD(P)H-binding protein n=1 Tax=Algoriphagus lutimaris TaxID=613197 RepID=UPI00196B10E1|nr:NAD(P)H-binding protein [Algoriphagus lutimaris]MBN3521584.1 NAD(P)H-binding protein [Algoriphagus lutimaris]